MYPEPPVPAWKSENKIDNGDDLYTNSHFWNLSHYTTVEIRETMNKLIEDKH